MVSVLLLNLALVVATCLALWVVSVIRRDASIVDLFWGLGFVLVGWTTYLLTSGRSAETIVLPLMVTLWGCRLSGYLAWRNWGKDEDYRYAAMRANHGDNFAWVSLFTVFGLQGVLIWFVALPIQFGIPAAGSWRVWDTVGIVLWAVGLFFEAVGDYQLARFKSDPRNRGRVMDRGLWRFTRHPNYFGDFLVWWGIYCVAADASTFLWTIGSPLLMSFLLVRVSGVRLLESTLRQTKEGYEDYVRRTSPFFPLPPKRRIADD